MSFYIIMNILNTLDTTKITIPLDDRMRTETLSQENIKKEKTDYNFKNVLYSSIKEHPNSITFQILQKLFNDTDEVGKILKTLSEQDKLLITTNRTVEIKKEGIDGEVNMHLDTNAFPDGKNRNIIIPWGLGTESYNLKLSNFFQYAKENMIKYVTDKSKYDFRKNQLTDSSILRLENRIKNIDYHLFEQLIDTFVKKIHDPSELKKYIKLHIPTNISHNKSRKSNSRINIKPNRIFTYIYSKTSSRKKVVFNYTQNLFNSIIINAYKKYKLNDNDYNMLHSEAPDKDGNITALIMTGNNVFHRRMSEEESIHERWKTLFELSNKSSKSVKPGRWRYLLNIYYNTDDFTASQKSV